MSFASKTALALVLSFSVAGIASADLIDVSSVSGNDTASSAEATRKNLCHCLPTIQAKPFLQILALTFSLHQAEST